MKKLLFLLLIEIIGVPSFAQSHTEQIDKIMRAFHDFGQFNGTVLVAEHGKIIYENGFGNASMEWNIPNAPDTKFMIGSISKQFTAMLVLQLVDKGLIDLNKTISGYLPYYPENTSRKITVRQLLNHTSGIPDIMNLPDFDEKYASKHFSTKQLLGNFDNLPLDFEPGTRFNYSNSGYNVLAAIIEEVTGKTYGTVLKEFITKPLNMRNTGYAPSISVISNLANAYLWAPLDGYIHPAFFDNSISKGSGGIYSTVDDLFKWDQALYTDTLVPETLRNKMMEPNKNGYGFGFWIYQWENPTTKKPSSKIWIKLSVVNNGYT
jgi:CubicO group peptidase (beta-lactamase class C family)